MEGFNETFWVNKIEEELNKSLLIHTLDIVQKRVKNAGDNFTFLKNGKELWANQQKYFAFMVKNIPECQENNRVHWEYFYDMKKGINLCKDNHIFDRFDYILVDNLLEPTILNKDNALKLFEDLKGKIKDKNKLYSFVNKDIFKILKESKDFNVLHEKLGKIAGVNIYLNENIPTVDNKVNVMVFTKGAISFAGNVVKIETLRDKDAFKDLVRGLYVYGCEINDLQNVSGCVVSFCKE